MRLRMYYQAAGRVAEHHPGLWQQGFRPFGIADRPEQRRWAADGLYSVTLRRYTDVEES